MVNVEQRSIAGRKLLIRPASSQDTHKGTLVLLHGYGADEYDLMGLAPYFDAGLQILSIRGPGSTPYGGASWFDIGMDSKGDLVFNAEQALKNCQGVIELLTELQQEGLIPDAKVILGGFSQGASLSQAITLSRPDLISALLVMSGRLVEGISTLLNAPDALKDLPVFAGHGTGDQVIPIKYGREIVSFWSNYPVRLVHYEYQMAHEINQLELEHIQNWFDDHVF